MSEDPHRLDPGELRRRVADSGWLGGGLAVAGAVMLFLGWWGVSGAATVGEQLPYIASGSIPGAALVVAAAVLLSRESAQRVTRRSDALVAELHSLLVEDAPAATAAPIGDTTAAAPPTEGHVALPGGERYHRAGCVLVAGKAGVEQVDAAAIAERHLSPCEVCEPERPAV